MAFQNVNVSATRKATDLKIDESITGYVAAFEASRSIEGQTNIVMQDLDGNRYVLFSAGNLKYLINDGKIKEGLLTRITRLADRVVKGKKSTSFSVEQDPEQSINTGNSLAQARDTATAALASKTSIAQQANRLSSAVKRG